MSQSVVTLIRDLIPSAPEIGLYLAPDIPPGKRDNAIRDYATSVRPDEIHALYDATLTGNAKDGAVFTDSRLVFQNNDFSPAQEIRYEDIVRVSTKRKFILGHKVYVDANRGRATVTFAIDFSGRPKAAEFVARFLHEAMMITIASEESEGEVAGRTDAEVVRRALNTLVSAGDLSETDRDQMLAVLDDAGTKSASSR